ncbi:hypothetical protein DXG03_005298 [Asterophora parasitica]|uniref:Thioredoxin domain-containing protein n=1 Tax=Asterophora parasitica TaxID=117018 RepID=A0A9P7KBH5_9AGAR|nr:hypothetical protein DXG03_005298 [Asterophora parasitica]
MHFFAVLRDLPLSLLITSLALATNALPVTGTQLTPDNFADLTANGLWFIEYFSPYCGHCRHFEPTWKQLVEESATTAPTVHLAQVDCAVHGDLCTDKGINSYPTMRMYNNGDDLGRYTGYRELPDLHAFIKRHVDAVSPPPPPPPLPTPTPPRSNVNLDGEVLKLTSTSFASHLAEGPMFVKFFAPWCGHCKKLAPVWRQLAKHMRGQLNIAEVDCDDHGALCKAYDVKGYPTLVYITAGGARSDYNGGRKLEQLRAFAEKASSADVQPIEAEELDGLVDENEVLYLLIHSAADTNIVETVQRASTPLLGSPSVYTSDDPALLTRFAIPQTSTWALLALKDHDLTPTSLLPERAATGAAMEDKVRKWLLENRLPTTVELTQDTLVVIADHQRLVYYDTDTTDSHIKLTSTTSLFAAVEAAAAGKLSYKNSENAIERLARYLSNKLTSFETYVVTYPWRAAFLLVVFFVALFFGIKRLIADDIPSDYRKVERLD